MATVKLSFSPAPVHVRTARLVGVAVARRAGVREDLLDEVRLAIGEACTRAVALHRQYGLSDPVLVEMSDAGQYTVRVVDRAPVEASVGLAALPPTSWPTSRSRTRRSPPGWASRSSPGSWRTSRSAPSTRASAPRCGWSGRSAADSWIHTGRVPAGTRPFGMDPFLYQIFPHNTATKIIEVGCTLGVTSDTAEGYSTRVVSK